MLNKSKIKNILKNKTTIKFIIGIGIVVIVAVPIGATARKIKLQNYAIAQLTQDKNDLNSKIQEQKSDISILNAEIDARIKNEESLNNTIKDLSNINSNLQKENKKITKDLLYNETRVSYLEQRTAELKGELSKTSKNVRQSNGIKIAVDIGHNMKPDTGASSEYGLEDTFTKEVGESLIAQLQNSGYEVVNVHPTKVESVNDSLEQRINKANEADVDLFVSIHFNAFKDEGAQGTEVFMYESDDELNKVGQKIIDNFEKYGFKDRGVKTANYSVLRNAKVPAILIECGFLTNTQDMARYEADKMAENILNGIKEVF